MYFEQIPVDGKVFSGCGDRSLTMPRVTSGDNGEARAKFVPTKLASAVCHVNFPNITPTDRKDAVIETAYTNVQGGTELSDFARFTVHKYSTANAQFGIEGDKPDNGPSHMPSIHPGIHFSCMRCRKPSRKAASLSEVVVNSGPSEEASCLVHHGPMAFEELPDRGVLPHRCFGCSRILASDVLMNKQTGRALLNEWMT